MVFRAAHVMLLIITKIVIVIVTELEVIMLVWKGCVFA